jgi:hypothetical protein
MEKTHKGKYKAIGSSRTVMKNHTAILGLEFILKNRALVLGLSVFEISYKLYFICSVKQRTSDKRSSWPMSKQGSLIKVKCQEM